MPRYIVRVEQVYESHYLVYADDADEAEDIVRIGDGWEDTGHRRLAEERIVGVTYDGTREEEVDA